MIDCVFCKMLQGDTPARMIREYDDIFVILSLENHPLVIPKKHIKDIYELDSESGKRLMEVSTQVANAMKKGLGCDGILLVQTNEKAADQTVFHIHIHLFPKWKDESNEMNIEDKDADEEIKEKFIQSIANEL